MPVSVNVSGTWRSVPYPKVNVSGSWHDVQNIYVNVSGSWKAMYSYWYSYGSWGSCSATCGGGTQTRSATCYRTGSVACSDDYCTRAGVSKGATSQSCNTQSCEEERYTLSSSNKNYVLFRTLQNDFHHVNFYWDNVMMCSYNEFEMTPSAMKTSTCSYNGYTYRAGSYKYEEKDPVYEYGAGEDMTQYLTGYVYYYYYSIIRS